MLWESGFGFVIATILLCVLYTWCGNFCRFVPYILMGKFDIIIDIGTLLLCMFSLGWIFMSFSMMLLVLNSMSILEHFKGFVIIYSSWWEYVNVAHFFTIIVVIMKVFFMFLWVTLICCLWNWLACKVSAIVGNSFFCDVSDNG